MQLKKNFLNEKICLFLILFFSIIFNYHSGNRGVFPADSFAFFDSGQRILNGQFPFKDYWVVSGPFIDYFQAFLFSLFGINWQVYILQASIINSLFAISTFFFLKELGLKSVSNCFYCVSLSILAYPVSGTPFVDQHSAFLSIIGIYIFIFALKENKNIYWLLLPFIFGFAFLSKQVPAAYLLISMIGVLIYNFFFNNRKNNIKVLRLIIASSLFFLLLLIIILKLSEININSFIQQYLLYPLSIGESRIENYKINFYNFFIKYKLIHLFFIPYTFFNIFKLIKIKNYYKSFNFILFLSIFLLAISLITHQLLTKNQNFIFFLIPLMAALTHIEVNKISQKPKLILLSLIIFLCFFSTAKYYKRFNLDRKFHELTYVNFDNTTLAKKIDKKLLGLNWITPETQTKADSLNEVNMLVDTKSVLAKDNRKKMLISHYAFFSTILKQDLNAPSRWYPMDGTAFPIKGNKYFNSYKIFFKNIILDKEIEVIYITKDMSKNIIFNYLNRECFKKEIIFPYLLAYSVKKDCEDFNSKS